FVDRGAACSQGSVGLSRAWSSDASDLQQGCHQVGGTGGPGADIAKRKINCDRLIGIDDTVCGRARLAGQSRSRRANRGQKIIVDDRADGLGSAEVGVYYAAEIYEERFVRFIGGVADN